MAPQPIHILPRAGSDSSSNSMYIAGFVVAGVVLLGAVGWLTVRFLRKRAQLRDGDKRGAAFLNVRGLVKEDGEKNGDEYLPRYGY
jgi:LPXTG-motif cell wall-anchored protein